MLVYSSLLDNGHDFDLERCSLGEGAGAHEDEVASAFRMGKSACGVGVGIAHCDGRVEFEREVAEASVEEVFPVRLDGLSPAKGGALCSRGDDGSGACKVGTHGDDGATVECRGETGEAFVEFGFDVNNDGRRPVEDDGGRLGCRDDRVSPRR